MGLDSLVICGAASREHGLASHHTCSFLTLAGTLLTVVRLARGRSRPSKRTHGDTHRGLLGILGILQLLWLSKRYRMHARFSRAPFRILSLPTGSSYSNNSSPNHARANRVPLG